jgi:hypothetical protein
MPKTFYTDRDIEDLAKRGVISLLEDDDVVLTDLARDKAMRLGIEIVHKIDRPSSAPERPYITKLTSPSAIQFDSDEGTRPPVGPERPYITKMTSPSATSTGNEISSSGSSSGDELYDNVRAEVVARLGDAVDPQLLDTIIRRVLQNVGVK